MNYSKLIFQLVLIACIPALFIQDAHAYLDPGTGSLIFQMIVGTILAATMAIKMYWRRIKAYFSRSQATEEPQSVAENPPASSLEGSKPNDTLSRT